MGKITDTHAGKIIASLYSCQLQAPESAGACGFFYKFSMTKHIIKNYLTRDFFYVLIQRLWLVTVDLLFSNTACHLWLF